MTELNSYFPSYDGTYNADDPLVAPWWVPGWTAQDKISEPAGPGSITGPFFPSNLAFVRVTGEYFDGNSSGIPGFLTVMMSDSITVQDAGQYFRMPQRLTGAMNFPSNLSYNNWGSGILYLALGRLDITLFATDQTASGSVITTDSGSPLTYWVTEHFMGGRQFQITVPSASAPGPADINSLIVAGSVTPYAYDPVSPMGQMLIPVPPPSTS
jgi:hypothetical protein